ncbi:MAG: sigma-70 family RNA polymerase sigma factor [Lachnospiraceae bacterium]|nr:sigma-70 family RNA polymerase sigma factor [Lachnospiraceae bacterium]
MGKEEKKPMYTLEGLMREYGNDVLRMAYLYVKDMHAAEDVFQDVFLKVNQKLDTYEGKASIKTWLLSVTMNTCKDYLKSAYQKRVVPMFDYLEGELDAEDGFRRIEQMETARTVREAVQGLPEPYRDVVICVYFREMGMEETARELGISTGTVKSRLFRAKEKLKRGLEGRLADA